MGRAVLPGNPPVEITLRRSARARRISLRVSGLDGRVTLTLPRDSSTADALAFSQEKRDWIRGHLASRHEPVSIRSGGHIQLRGVEISIETGAVRKAELRSGVILVPAGPDMVASRVKALTKQLARAELGEASARYAGLIGREVGRITLRDTRSRWGSCSMNGDLMFSWRLIMAPSDVLDYVAAHEVAHFIEMNHLAAFWAVVARICPNYKAPRRWLRENGQMLHRYRFHD